LPKKTLPGRSSAIADLQAFVQKNKEKREEEENGDLGSAESNLSKKQPRWTPWLICKLLAKKK